jgi:hypothetical protein
MTMILDSGVVGTIAAVVTKSKMDTGLRRYDEVLALCDKKISATSNNTH